jgi:hypothetical protein
VRSAPSLARDVDVRTGHAGLQIPVEREGRAAIVPSQTARLSRSEGPLLSSRAADDDVEGAAGHVGPDAVTLKARRQYLDAELSNFASVDSSTHGLFTQYGG